MIEQQFRTRHVAVLGLRAVWHRVLAPDASFLAPRRAELRTQRPHGPNPDFFPTKNPSDQLLEFVRTTLFTTGREIERSHAPGQGRRRWRRPNDVEVCARWLRDRQKGSRQAVNGQYASEKVRCRREKCAAARLDGQQLVALSPP